MNNEVPWWVDTHGSGSEMWKNETIALRKKLELLASANYDTKRIAEERDLAIAMKKLLKEALIEALDCGNFLRSAVVEKENTGIHQCSVDTWDRFSEDADKVLKKTNNDK
jgi:hypothetical protein